MLSKNPLFEFYDQLITKCSKKICAAPKTNTYLTFINLKDEMKLSKHEQMFSLKVNDLHYFRKKMCGPEI